MNQQIKNISFPVRLLNQLSAKDNCVICPPGIASVLSMVAEGVDKGILAEILDCLKFRSLGELRSNIHNMLIHPCEACRTENTINLFAGSDKLRLLNSFKQLMSNYYFANVCENVSEGTAFVSFRNISTFKARWLCEMERDVDTNNYFHNNNGSISRPVFLNCTEYLNYYIDHPVRPTIKAVALPYKLNNTPIPYELVLVDIGEQTLNETLLMNVFINMHKDKCLVEFPQFTVENEFDLISVMQSLGYQKIFDSKIFTDILTKSMSVNSFEHKAKIQVDERGTIAKAVTTMHMYNSIIIPDGAEWIRFNNPFYYFIRNSNTGEIIFTGKVNKLADYE